MKKIYLICLGVSLALSCAPSGLEDRMDNLESRIAALESVVESVNDNAIAINALYRSNLLITDFKKVYDSSGGGDWL